MRAEVIALALLLGCTCGSEEHASIAELVEKRGDVDRDFARSVGAWEAAPRGASFAIGDGVRTGEGASAALALEGGARIEMDPSTEIRFARGEGAASVDVATGAATLEAGDEEARIETDVGLAVLEPGARMRLADDGLTVLVGTAVLETDDGPRSIAEGESIGAEEPVAIEPPVEPPVEPPAEPPAEPQGGEEIATTGRVERESGDEWEALTPGVHRVAAGTLLRLARGGTVTLERGEDRVRAFGAGEVIVAPSEHELLETRGGRARVEAVGSEVRVRVPGGVIVATADEGSSAGTVHIESDATHVEAERGSIVVDRDDGEDATIGAGESARIEREARAEASDRPADLVVPAGGSIVVHDPAPALVVRFEAADCEGAAVELGGRGGLTHRLSRGRHSYTIRCGADRRGTGRVRVLGDSGRAHLPRAPPASVVDADGRSYTVLYQNQLPVITVRWRDAPPGGPYRLSFAGRRADEVGPQPRFAFASGDLTDGAHRFTVEGAGRRSPATTLIIRFDNAAATASVEEPANESFAAGERVRVRGVALPGWSVAVGGAPISLDAGNRFTHETTAPSSPLVIRLSHPRHGVHYYLRRPRGG